MNGPELDRRFAELLTQRGVLTEQTRDHLLGYAERQGMRLSNALIELRVLDPAEVLSGLQEVSGYTAIDPGLVAEDPSFTAFVTALLPPVIARAAKAVAIRHAGAGLQVAMAEPWDAAACMLLEAFTGGPVEPVVMLDPTLHIVPSAAEGAIEREWAQRADRPLGDVLAVAAERVHRHRGDGDVARTSDLVLAVHAVLCQAAGLGASDVHLDAERAAFRIRVRVDGRLRELATAPRALAGAFMRRLRELAGVDGASGNTVDGSFSSTVAPRRRIEVRLSVAAAVSGDRATLRLVDRGATLPTLASLGMDDETLAAIERVAAQPHGLVVIAGPTGSGKTSTLYALLGRTISGDRAVFTAEDPVEREIAGAVQVPCNAEHGLGFPGVLRSLLRQDPDVVMVGEARDAETALLGVQAANTGHLVLTSVHANSAAATVTRFLSLGIEPWVLASVLRVVVAQRLVRRLCPHCRIESPITPDTWRRVGGGDIVAPVSAFSAGGCDACGGTGYRGRIGIFELMACSPGLQRAITQGVPEQSLEEVARGDGMRTLREAGLARVRTGDTSLQEVLAITACDAAPPPVSSRSFA